MKKLKLLKDKGLQSPFKFYFIKKNAIIYRKGRI